MLYLFGSTGQLHLLQKDRPIYEEIDMEFNLVIFFIAIGLVIIAAVVAAVAAVTSSVAAQMHNKLDEDGETDQS